MAKASPARAKMRTQTNMRPPWSSSTLSTNPASRDTFDELSLHEEEQHDDRHDGQRGGGHQEVILGSVLLLKDPQRDLDRADVGAARHDQGPEERVPARQEVVQPGREQGRRRDRDHDLYQESQVAGSVELAGFPEVTRDGEKELAQQEDRQDVGAEWDDQGVVGVQPA